MESLIRRRFAGRVATLRLPFGLPRALRSAVPAVALGAAGAGLLSLATGKVAYWTVMDDELVYAKVARAFAHGSLLPTTHGRRIDYFPVLYSVLIAPFYGLLDPQSAFHAVHVFNAFLWASAVVPAYLLARELLPRKWSWAAAALALAVPWIGLATLMMSEVAAYPAFLWAFLACQRAIASPSARRDALAVAAIVLAFLARRELAILALVLPVAVVLYELSGGSQARPWPRLRRAVAAHRLLAAVYALGLAVLIPLAATGFAPRLLGVYDWTTSGSPVVAGMWESAASHLDAIAIGLGIVPFVLGAGWIYGGAIRSRSERTRAFAALAGVTIVLLALEVGSIDARSFGGITRDRYVFYLAPLLLIAAIACLLDAAPRWLGIAGATAFFAATVPWHALPSGDYFWVDSAIKPLLGLIEAEVPSLSAVTFLALCGIVLGAAVLAARRRLPGRAPAVAIVAIAFAFSGSVAGFDVSRLLSLPGPDGTDLTAKRADLNWIDRAVGGHSSVATLSYPVLLPPGQPLNTDWFASALHWWDAELWNDSVKFGYVTPDGMLSYLSSRFPMETLRLDRKTGRFLGTAHAAPYVLTVDTDPRFGLAGRRVASKDRLSVVAVQPPWRAAWATSGLDVDGWMRPNRPVTIRLYSRPSDPSRLVRATLVLLSAPPASSPSAYSLTGPRISLHGEVPAQGRYIDVKATVCVPAQGYADLTLRAAASADMPAPPLQASGPAGTRVVGPLLGEISTSPLARRCA